MKFKINILLPIVIAVILSGLYILSNPGLVLKDAMGLFQSWLTISFLVYLLWYFLFFLWEIKTHYKKWWFLPGLMILVGIMLTVYFLFVFKSREDFEWHSVVRIMIVSVLFLTIQYAIKAQQNISRLMLEKEQIQTENYKVQLKALRTQIDPHFLFNALNTLRSMVRHQDSNSEQFVMSLSDFYRQALKHYEDSTVQLAEELDVLKSYLFLMKSRNEKAVLVDIDVDENLYEHKLPTMALQIVVENCFKHNSMSSKKPLNIDIINSDDFYIEVCNNIQPKIDEVESSGHGLKILKKKYDLMKIQNGLLIEKTPDEFCVKLKLI